MPRLDHPDQAIPREIRILLVWLEHPMEISFSGFDIVTQIHLDQHVQRQSLTGFLDQGNLQLSQNLASCPITTKQVLGSDEIFGLGQFVPDSTEDFAVVFLLEVDDAGSKPHIPTLSRGALKQDGLKKSLRQVNMVARSGSFIVSSPLGIVAPRVDSTVLLASHVVTPASVDHAVTLDGLGKRCLFEIDVSQTLKCCRVGDMGSGSWRCCWSGGDHDSSHGIWGMGEKTCQRATSWTGADNEKGGLHDFGLDIRNAIGL